MEAYNKTVIYYFSGTGNSKNAARWISDTAFKMNVNAETVNIAQAKRRNIDPPGSDSLIFFTSPVHGFNYPPVMLNFILHFPEGKNSVVLMNTRAGMLIGKWITPGLSGLTFYLSALILTLKGYSVKGMYPVDLPSNWISLHPGLNERTVRFLHIKNRERVCNFTERIISGGSDFRCLREIIQDIMVWPISFLYYFIGRFAFAKTFYASRDCSRCGLCMKECPVNGIKMVDNRPFWTFRCESCMKCMSFCPEEAIETGHGFIAGISVLNSMILTGLFYSLFRKFFFQIENAAAQFLLESALFLLTLALSYRIIHYLMRYRIFERLMVYTSLTKLKFWRRRYRAMNDKDFKDHA